MTTETPSTLQLPSEGEQRPKPKEVHFASPVAGGSHHPPSRARTSNQSYRRRLTIDQQGEYAYKKTPSSTLMSSLQLGLQHAIGSLEPKPRRDILMTDFEDVESVDFPAAGSGSTPAHKFKDFTFKTYSPVAFRFFREAFGIVAEDFLIAMCDRPLREISNPGASGSLFYLSADDAFIIKTVQKKEAHFLQKLLPGYYLNLTQNKRTLLPKFFGLYRYKSGSINIRIVVMNNLLPSSIKLHEKYDLKGSTYKRKASPAELLKKSPTCKDLDYGEKHEEGIMLSPERFEALCRSVERDCKVLESFGIMDYSLLLGIHNIDHALRERSESAQLSASITAADTEDVPIPSRLGLGKNYSIISTENLTLAVAAEEDTPRTQYPEGFIQGRMHGDRVLLYLGVIDILQSYRLKKKLEHSFKSIITDGNTVSVHNPSFYARRFQDYMTSQVFKKEKTKYRTRKNSTNVQLRGRKPVSIRAGGGTRPLDRQNSHPSPSHDLPTYTQATRSSDPAITPLTMPDRERSMSDPAAKLPEIPTLQVYKPPLESIESVPGTGSSDQQVISDKSHDLEAGSHDQQQVKEHPNESSDFARNVRCGTSTPIDESPTIEGDRSRTFDPEYTAGEGLDTLDTQQIELSVSKGPVEAVQ